MRAVWTVANARAADAAAQRATSEQTLIERASFAVACRAVGMLGGAYGRRVLVVAGKGHNGADALWSGVHLRHRGARVDVVLAMGTPADAHGQAPLAALLSAGARVVTPTGAAALLRDADLVVDGVLGVGARIDDPPWPKLGAACAAAHGLVLAVDVPTGVDADTGAVHLPVRADVTVTFGATKVGIATGAGALHAGVVDVVDIGLAPAASSAPPPLGIFDADDICALLPAPAGETTKYRRGVVGVVGGGPEYVGAAVLATSGALRAGAGMVRLHAPLETSAEVRAQWPEVVAVEQSVKAIADDTKVDAWAIGPGLGTGDDAVAVLRAVLATDKPVVADADAITLLARDSGALRARTAETLLTPHTGEFARLTGVDPEDDRFGAARRSAEQLGVTMLLKGRHTVIVAPDGRARFNPTGTSVLATAGSGDVLTGACGAYLAAGLRALDAAAVAAWLHGLAALVAAGDGRHPAPIVASDVAAAWPEAVRRIGGGAPVA